MSYSQPQSDSENWQRKHKKFYSEKMAGGEKVTIKVFILGENDNASK